MCIRDSAERHHQVLVEAGEPGRGGVLVAGERDLVLLPARDVPLLGHLLAVLPHRHAGARLAHARVLGREVPRPQVADRAELVAPGLAAREREHRALQVLAVGAVSYTHLTLPTSDLV